MTDKFETALTVTGQNTGLRNKIVNVSGNRPRLLDLFCGAGANEIIANKENLAAAYKIDWFMNRHELRQAIPPAYTEYIGKYLMQAVTEAVK